MNNTPVILVTNDDGINAKGVHEMISTLVKFGHVIAVCPDGPRSGQSMALTVNAPLRLHRHADYKGAEMYSVNGTPVDCVKLAMHVLFRDRRPDILCSGINHGSNAAINVLYSGTMGAVFEGCASNIPSVGFSLTDHDPDADFSHCLYFVDNMVSRMLQHGLPQGVALNVNIPDSNPAPTRWRLARGSKGNWNDEYKLYTDPNGQDFYWLAGDFISDEPDAEDTDEWCLHHGIASVVPVTLDRTYIPAENNDILSAYTDF